MRGRSGDRRDVAAVSGSFLERMRAHSRRLDAQAVATIERAAPKVLAAAGRSALSSRPRPA